MANKTVIVRDYEKADWDRFISISDAAAEYGKRITTLRNNIRSGLFEEGVDCVKFGKVWIFDKKALDKVYREAE